MSAARFAPIVRSRVATAPRFVAFRSISSTPNYQKSPVDAAKDTLKKADEVVSNAAVKGINKGENAAHKIKEAVGSTSEAAKSQADSMKGEAQKQAGKAQGEAEHLAGKMQGKGEETLGEMKGKAEEAKGKAEEAKRKHLG
ncbi:uncharacterized protein N7477_000136 [Penicillium maclennaniae]|uniref:uncharacterized protein n=1 Tax=Penicillium maclennaniae TaxID=1343394 RepID=UPI00253F9578|nr:uncharacterized protein N7477_000136 [Penicillium maclennaniae]KAJ5683791.1 hypothetical protein N7477_000136 [Penicillium maclennaniae]